MDKIWVILQEDGAYSNNWWHISGVVATNKQDAVDNSKHLLVSWIMETFARYRQGRWIDNDLRMTLSYLTLDKEGGKFSGFCWYLKLNGKYIPDLAYVCENYKVIGKEVTIGKLGLMPRYDDAVLYIDI